MKNQKVSWKDASLLCKFAGGLLPVIRRRDEMADISSLFSLATEIEAVETTFIGIDPKTSFVVSFCFGCV